MPMARRRSLLPVAASWVAGRFARLIPGGAGAAGRPPPYPDEVLQDLLRSTIDLYGASWRLRAGPVAGDPLRGISHMDR